MEITKVGEITPPLNSGQVTISIGTNPNDEADGYFYFNTDTAPALIKFKELLAEATDLPVFKPFYKTDVKKFVDANAVAQKLSDKKYLKIYARVLAKMGVVKANKIAKIKTYNDIIDSVQTSSKSFYKPSGLKMSLEMIGVTPSWTNYTGHFVGTLVTPICLTQDKSSIEESPLSEKINQLLTETNITLMEPVDFLREANWVVTEKGLSLQSDGGADFTEVVLGMLGTSGAAFSKMVKEGDGSAASLAPLGINTDILAAAASHHTGCGTSGNEKVKNAFTALENIEIPTETTEKSTTVDPTVVKQEVGKLLKQFKALEPKKAFKGLGLLHQMSSLINKLEDVPAELKALVQKLEMQRTKLKPVFSKQISKRFDKGLTELEELPVINSTQDLEAIFGTILKLYKGWQKFVPEEDHPQKEKIERVDKEVDVLKEYEQKIVPLRKQHEKMENSEEKEELTTQINTLIDEAKAALA